MTTNRNDSGEIPPLSLVPDDEVIEDKTDSTKYCIFKLFTSPAAAIRPNNPNTAYYSFALKKVDGTQSIRDHIKWTKDTVTVLDGQNITDADDKLQLLQQMCSGEALTAFNAGVQVCHMANWMLARGRAVQAQPP